MTHRFTIPLHYVSRSVRFHTLQFPINISTYAVYWQRLKQITISISAVFLCLCAHQNVKYKGSPSNRKTCILIFHCYIFFALFFTFCKLSHPAGSHSNINIKQSNISVLFLQLPAQKPIINTKIRRPITILPR